MEDQMAQGGLRGFLFMQHHEVPLKFDKQGLFRRKVECRTVNHQLFIYDAKEGAQQRNCCTNNEKQLAVP